MHAHLPYAPSTFNNSDEIRIAVQNQDHCLLPSKSSLHIQGKLVKEDGTSVTNTRFITNAIYHLFEEARYELNAVEIDKNKIVGLTSLVKHYTSVYEAQSKFLFEVMCSKNGAFATFEVMYRAQEIFLVFFLKCHHLALLFPFKMSY